MNQNHLILLLRLVTTLLVGCSDDRAVAISREAADRQAAQNLEMSKHYREVAAAHHKLADVHHDVQDERENLSGGWNELESERCQIARDRRTESLLAVLVPLAGTVVVIIAALYFAGLLLRDARTPEAVDAQLCELLMTEFLAEEPRLLPSRGEPHWTPLLTHNLPEEPPIESNRDHSEPNP
ncbi:MAG: hypothetical protein WD851_20825 [Pirellulales bacterium]